MPIQDVMSTRVVSCRFETPLNDVAGMMWEYDCGAIPVLGNDGRLAGMITDRDICMAAYTQGRPLHALHAGQAMSKEAFSCRPTDEVDAALRVMTDRMVRRVPIVNGDRQLVGMLSLADVARYAVAKKDALQQKVVHALTTICQPRPHASQQQPPPDTLRKSPHARA